jgi:hypothetical protein
MTMREIMQPVAGGMNVTDAMRAIARNINVDRGECSDCRPAESERVL